MSITADAESEALDAAIVRVRAPEALIAALDAWAAAMGTTRSGAARDLFTTGLQERGLWPPAPMARNGARS